MRAELRREHESLDELYEAMEDPAMVVSARDKQRLEELGTPKESDLDLADYPTLTLHHVEGYTESEIAGMLGIDERTVRRRMDREKKSLMALAA
jgi:hypothetical protein